MIRIYIYFLMCTGILNIGNAQVSWRKLSVTGTPPTSRGWFHAGSIVCNETWYVFGGNDGTNKNDVFSFDLNTQN